MRRLAPLLWLIQLLPLPAVAVLDIRAHTGDACRIEVNVRYEKIVADLQAAGNRRGALVIYTTRRAEDLEQCDRLERRQQDGHMVTAYQRLGAAMDTLIAGGRLDGVSAQAIADDLATIRDYKPAPYRDAYLQRHVEYLRLVEHGPTAAQRAAPRLAPPLPPPPPPPALLPLAAPSTAVGRLRSWGTYLGTEAGQTATALRDGGVLLLGHGRARPDADDPAVVSSDLRERRLRPAPGPVEATPRQWDPQRRGWLRLPAPPECPRGERYAHTATLLPDDKVLVAGGLCDEPKARDDASPHGAFGAASLWDAKARRWLAAPVLHEARLHHSATLLADGSVLIAGGENDPALAAGSGEPVLSSVERFAGGHMAAVPPLVTARAGHSATLLADGSVLVVGGFDAGGRAIAAAERWALGDPAWRTVAGPQAPRHGHAATLLADGRLLVTGGVGADGRRLTAAELWDPQGGEWRAMPSLPVPLAGHGAARLADGRVLIAGGARIAAPGAVPGAWIWGPGEAEWRVAGLVESEPERRHADPVAIEPHADGGAVLYGSRGVLRWSPSPLRDERTPPLWRAAPAAARLNDGRVMFVGVGASDRGDSQSAYLWDPGSGHWRAAGRLTGATRSHAALIVLRSGQVLQLAHVAPQGLVCDTWESAQERWRPCGTMALAHGSPRPLQPGLLEDGRAFVIANRREAFVFDPTSEQWAAWPPLWDGAGVPLGAPVRHPTPLATLRDPVGGRVFEINDAAARWLQGESDLLRLLWHANASQWTYVLPGGMGRDAQLLPDGCAISSTPLALFDATSGKAAPLPDPGLGMVPGRGTMLVLPDGSVLVAGVPDRARDPGAGFFRGKASCKGFEAESDDAGYIAGGLLGDVPVAATAPASAPVSAPASTAASTAASSDARPQSPMPWPQRLAASALDHRWVLIAAGAPLLGWLLLRRTPFTRVQLGSPGWLRVLVWGGVIVLVVPAAAAYWRFSQAQQAAACAEGLAACRPETAARADVPLQGVPCRFVGLWTSQHGGIQRRVELHDDGSYAMAASVAGVDPAGGYQGHWAIEGQAMVWRHAGVLDRDVNALLDDFDGRFTLVESNGSKTLFQRVRALPSTRCPS